jgi:hemerythrin-like domain-containing protein
MGSHHGFRRDLARFARALERIARGDTSRSQAVAEEWQKLYAGLHAHHHAEDTGLFPNLAKEHPSLHATIAKLAADHRRIDPLLERGNAAFAELPNVAHARAVIAELDELLGPHLALEEAEVIPFLRSAKDFPAPPTEADAEMYAHGFAWAMHGLAPAVLTALDAMVPESLRTKLPAARASFEARCERVWGSTRAGAALTPIPEGDPV